MRNVRRFFRRFLLLSKRLLRRPAYLGVLLLVPLFALALALFAGQESGVLRIALVREEPSDPAAAAAVERLLTERSVLRVTEFADETEAREALRRGQVDAAWIFSDGFSRELERFGGRGHADAVTVLEREDNVFLMLSREKLFAAIYPETSREIFLDYLKTELGAESLTRDEAARWYDSLTTTERVVRFETLEGGEAETDGSYLTAPLRGLMALLLVLCGMASGLYSYREEREGSFVWLPSRARRLVPLLSHVTAILPAALAALAAMALAGITVDPLREALLMLLYIPAAALFCELLRCLCPREEHYGALIPVLAAAMLVFCPVFLDLGLLPWLTLLLPPTWALRAAWDASALWGLLGYTLALALLTALAARLRQVLVHSA